ncbi:MAG: hypothetical protein O3C57_01945, partial [Verrucomicrobia bacterium]|nr:hypothetical protein [Verrucomicrobiota bacterium]
LIADNYFGYCKKEVKTQISMSANMYGGAEEEHAGGAIAFPSYALGDEYRPDSEHYGLPHSWAETCDLYRDAMDLQPGGHGIDKCYADIIYVPQNAVFSVPRQCAEWISAGKTVAIKLLPGRTYVYPSGYRVQMEKHPGAPSWRLEGTMAEGTMCHKPCTVSGGGKSEISKSISYSYIFGSFYVHDFETDMQLVEEIVERNYSDRYRREPPGPRRGRKLLSPERSLGSVIKLLTPSVDEFTDEFNQWLESIPPHIMALVLIIKRFHDANLTGEDWRKPFSVAFINGRPGHELKYKDRTLVACYLRVGHDVQNAWRTFKLRQDFVAARKVSCEDDITASIVLPANQLSGLNPDYDNPSVKLIVNCEYRFFQRPDDAIVRGFDLQAEADLAASGNFCSNFEPLPVENAAEMFEDTLGFQEFTKPMQDLIREAAGRPAGEFFVSSDSPRLVDGKPSKNPRYLQLRPDLKSGRDRYLAIMCTRMHRRLRMDQAVHMPVNAVLTGRRNNPPEPGVRPLAVFNPIHYQELPELFMDFLTSVTGKSPSTTGAGTEGALTKAPFNCLAPVTDMNNALVSMILTGYNGFSSAAGYVGPKYHVAHDLSLLIPELWSRMRVKERDPAYLIEHGFLARLEDFEHEGEMVLASRLGYRITSEFTRYFLGRIFDSPAEVFSEDMLAPELQDLEIFVDGVNNIVEAQKRIAQQYFDDGSVAAACSPLKALLHIMVHGHYEGKCINDADVRNLFKRDQMIKSDWYQERLQTKQNRDIALWESHVSYLTTYVARDSHQDIVIRFDLEKRLATAKKELAKVKSAAYLKSLHGTIGADMLYRGA